MKNSDSARVKSVQRSSYYLNWIQLILDNPVGNIHDGIKRIVEMPKSIPHILGWIITHSSIKSLTEANSNEITRVHNEFGSHFSLNESVLNSLKEFDNIFDSLAIGQPEKGYLSTPEILYVITRLMRPSVVVETGVASGISSTYILQALEDNKKGELYSIDASERIPRGKNKLTGWIIPQKLRYRWHFILGESSERLLPLLEELDEIDIFLHDSLHTYENMLWEYKTAWPFIRKGGLLLSHDIILNTSFLDFSSMINHKPTYLGFNFGGTKK